MSHNPHFSNYKALFPIDSPLPHIAFAEKLDIKFAISFLAGEVKNLFAQKVRLILLLI